MDTIKEIMLWAVATLAVVVACAFICGTLIEITAIKKAIDRINKAKEIE